MKKKLTNNLTLYFNNIFPYKNSINTNYTNNITIGIGGNIGNVPMLFKKLFKVFKSDSRFYILETSPLLKNPPFGYLEQNDFINAIVVLKTNLSPLQALKVFQQYELRFKRKRSFQDAPRTLDIDIIFFNNIIMNTKKLTLPHHGYKQRDSVLIPLKYISSRKI